MIAPHRPRYTTPRQRCSGGVPAARGVTIFVLRTSQCAKRLAIASQPIVLEHTQLQQTVSLGCALLGPGESSGAALKRADQALYRAKHEGRNRSLLAP